MTITLKPDLEARIREKAERENTDLDSAATDLLIWALEMEAKERAEMIGSIQRGLEASDAGRVRPADQVFADMRP